MNPKWKTTEFFKMWPRALFRMKAGKPILERHFGKVAGVYVLYRDDVPHYIGHGSILSHSIGIPVILPHREARLRFPAQCATGRKGDILVADLIKSRIYI
jgi:hypothetical protein